MARPLIVVIVEDKEVSCTFVTDKNEVYGATTMLLGKDDADFDTAAQYAAGVLIKAAQHEIDAMAAGTRNPDNCLFEKVEKSSAVKVN